EMRQADAVPGTGRRRRLRLELEDLERRAARHANPSDLARGRRTIDLEEGPDPFRRRIGHADERAAEDVPVEPDGRVEVRDGEADVTERARLHWRLPRLRSVDRM